MQSATKDSQPKNGIQLSLKKSKDSFETVIPKTASRTFFSTPVSVRTPLNVDALMCLHIVMF